MTITKKKCGNPKGRCAKQGPIHETALLTWKEGNTTKTLYVPRELRAEVAAWIAHIVTQLLDKGSLLRKAFPCGFGSLKDLAFRILEALRNTKLSDDEYRELAEQRERRWRRALRSPGQRCVGKLAGHRLGGTGRRALCGDRLR